MMFHVIPRRSIVSGCVLAVAVCIIGRCVLLCPCWSWFLRFCIVVVLGVRVVVLMVALFLLPVLQLWLLLLSPGLFVFIIVLLLAVVSFLPFVCLWILASVATSAVVDAVLGVVAIFPHVGRVAVVIRIGVACSHYLPSCCSSCVSASPPSCSRCRRPPRPWPQWSSYSARPWCWHCLSCVCVCVCCSHRPPRSDCCLSFMVLLHGVFVPVVLCFVLCSACFKAACFCCRRCGCHC